MQGSRNKHIVIGISGASGAIYGKMLVDVLSKMENIRVHLVATPSAEMVLYHEMGMKMSELISMVDYSYDIKDVGASIASGSFPTYGMIVAPCSMKSLSAISHSYTNNLLVRVADVMLKERKPLIIVTRETPLNSIHLENMLRALRAGAIIMPAMPSFYHRPSDIDTLVMHFIGRILHCFGIDNDYTICWKGDTINNIRREILDK